MNHPAHQNNQVIHSLNRLATPSPSVFNPSLPRFHRRARLFSLLFVVVLGSLYCFHPNTWNNPFSSSLTSNPSIPTVTRDVLDRLDKIDQSQFQDEERAVEELIQSNFIRFNQSFHPGLPFVTSLPADRHSSSSSNSNKKKLEQNCPDDLPYPCAFLVAGYVGEQETKAQIHLHQLGLLAMALNRTLVLPQVAQSRMGSCLEYPFDLYYQPDALHRLGVRTLTHEKFLDWFTTSASNSNTPSAKLVAIVNRHQVPSAPTKGSISFGRPSNLNHQLTFKPDRQFCLKNYPKPNSKLKNKILFNFDQFPPLTIVAPEKWHQTINGRQKFSEGIVQSVLDSEGSSSSKSRKNPRPRVSQSPRGGQPDILVVNYELRYPFLDPTSKHSLRLISNEGFGKSDKQTLLKLPEFQNFPYASIWIEMVEGLVKQLPAMLGVHWRQENIQTEDLKKCARSLVTTVESIKNNYPSLRAIYLSTDFPIEQVHRSSIDLPQQPDVSSSRAHSGTFSKLITPEHHQIMKDLMQTQFTSPLTWLTFNSLIDNLELPTNLTQKLILLPIFQDLKELDRMMKVSQLDQQEQRDYRNSENQKEIQRLIKEKFKLKVASSSLSSKDNDKTVSVDGGIIGILEKIILVKSSFFLTGVPDICSKSSSFTSHIVNLRHLFIDLVHWKKFGYLLDFDSSFFQVKPLFNLVEFWF